MFRLRITGDLGFEFWKDIPGYEGLYQASTYGRIKSADRIIHMGNGVGYDRLIEGKELKQFLKDNGLYLRTCLCHNGVHKKYQVHRLIALTFPEICGEYFADATVDHIDGNGLNNSAFNLCFKTLKENIHNPNTYPNFLLSCLDKLKLATTKGANEKRKKTMNKPVKCVDNGKIYENRFTASKETGINISSIWRCCVGKQAKAGGYMWEYV